MGRYFFIAGFLFFISMTAYTQPIDSLHQQVVHLPDDFYSKIEQKYTSIDQKLSKKTVKYLKQLQKQEIKWFRRLSANDSSFAGSTEIINKKYQQLIVLISGKKENIDNVNLSNYSGYIDTLTTTLSFLEKFNDLSNKIKLPTEALNQLKSTLNNTAQIQEFIDSRRQVMKDILSKYTQIPENLKNQYTQFSKTAWYYKAQVEEYRNLLSDPDKVEATAIKLLNEIPAFQQFMHQNSQLASLFSLPQNFNNNVNLAGLQTRSSIQQIIQQKIFSGGPNAMMQVQQSLLEAHSQINQMKERLNEMANGGSGDADLPDFKPNGQKTKTFLKRLEYGFDIQFGKSTSLLPSSADMALSVGYKLNDKSIIGIGGSYKMGMGSIEHIRITHEGVGIRSFLDWKAPFGSKGILGTLWFSGGYEINYNASFKNIEQLKNELAWQRSALIGLSKKYKISNKIKGEMKLLFDFLANNHFPETSPIVFRLGYKF